MKNYSKAIALVAATVGLASAAHAQVTIYITGSTAFRGSVFNAIKTDLFGANLTSVTPAGATTSTSTVTYYGTIPALFGAQTVTIKTAFSGSVEGIVNLLGVSNPAGAVAQPTYLNVDGTTDSNTVADLAFSDVFQNTTQYDDSIYTSLANTLDVQVGVVTFAYTRSSAAPSSITNITSQQAQQLFASGSVPLWYFTGNKATDTSTVYLAGRYPFSGTRLTYQADCGFGANSTATLYKLGAAPTYTPILDTAGQTGGSGVVTILQNAIAPFIGTLGTGDSATIGVDHRLTYSGVAFSKAAVQNGQYSLWGYEHIFAKPTASANALKLVNGTSNANPLLSNGLAKAIDTELASDSNNVQLGTMNVSRQGDGAPISN